MGQSHLPSAPPPEIEPPGPNSSEPPRVLFISVNPFSATSNNGKTFASFFQGYPTDSLAQLYFHRELPSSPVCNRYFRITDEDVLRNFPRVRKTAGSEVVATSKSTRSIPRGAHERLKSSRLARLTRQLMWTRVSFDEPRLTTWVTEFDPDVIMFCGGDAAALYPKVSKLARKCGASLVLYITDDYVLPSRSVNLATRVSRFWVRQEFRDFCRRADLVVTIGDKMSATYKREFGVDSRALMNVVEIPPRKPDSKNRPSRETPLTLLYAGSLHSNRWRVLRSLTDSIQRLDDQGIRMRLVVHGPPPEGKASAALHSPPFCEHRGLLSPEALQDAMNDADILVHVEASDRKSVQTTALSVSTKIPEYLASGRCILAIGPNGIASMDYLAENDAALTVDPTDEEGLDQILSAVAMDPQILNSTADKAFRLAQKNHDGLRVRQELWNRLEQITS